MVDYTYSSMPKLQQVSTCKHCQLVLQSRAQQIMHNDFIESSWKLQLGIAIAIGVSLLPVAAPTSFLLC